jgi:hypothetical protein
VKAESLLISISLISACVTPEDEPPMAPEPIGSELLGFTTPATGLNGCVEAHLYRAQRAVQFQCFDPNGTFSWENRGTLSVEGEAALDAAIAVTDFDNTEPAPDYGSCKGDPDAISVSMTVWVGEASFTYHPACPTVGVAELNEVAETLIADISDCNEPGTTLDLLDSVEPGCRSY